MQISLHMLKLVPCSVVSLLVIISLVLAVRKLTYKLYLSFFTADRAQDSHLNGEFLFYWRIRAYLFPAQLARLYGAWVLGRIDRYIPLIDCDRQAAKAQYFYNYGWQFGMSGFVYRYVNPKAWPILFFRYLKTVLFALLFSPQNQCIEKLKNQPAHK